MAFSQNVWSQLKNLTADDLKEALERDGWVLDNPKGAVLAYVKEVLGEQFVGGDPKPPMRKRATIHYHPRKTYGPKLLKGLLADIGWEEDDMRRLKLIK